MMKKRSTRKPSAATLLTSSRPPPRPAKAETPTTTEKNPVLSAEISPAADFGFNFGGHTDIASLLNKKINKGTNSVASGSKRMQTTGLAQSPIGSVKTIADVKDLASSNLESFKRLLENSDMEILKDFEASKCRLQKRYKIQTQTCLQLVDEAEKEYKKMSDRINEGQEAMEASYEEFIAEVQATTSRLCKVSIPELAKVSEKGIDSLRSRFGILSDAA